jgi:signal recognition particle subunit SRP19
MPDYFYVYPGYLTEGSTRREGRRVPAPLAVRDVTSEEIAEAARKLGYHAEVQSDKHYPRQFFTYSGRVKLTKKSGATKTAVLRALVSEIRRARPPGSSPHKGGHR